MKINIAIDGPSAAGKSTIAKLIAEKYNYCHLDTGAMYRLVAYKALKLGLDFNNEELIAEMIDGSKISMLPNGDIYLDGDKISDEIRTNEISMAASNISKLAKVRASLVRLQQNIAGDKGYVVDGRDIGSVVLKDAEVKFYLTATVESRALRRFKQNQEQNISNKELVEIEKEISARDYQDTHRENSPLKVCDDAIYVDNSDMSIDETISLMAKYIDSKIRQ